MQMHLFVYSHMLSCLSVCPFCHLFVLYFYITANCQLWNRFQEEMIRFIQFYKC